MILRTIKGTLDINKNAFKVALILTRKYDSSTLQTEARTPEKYLSEKKSSPNY